LRQFVIWLLDGHPDGKDGCAMRVGNPIQPPPALSVDVADLVGELSLALTSVTNICGFTADDG
jgi:hypothetical protein